MKNPVFSALILTAVLVPAHAQDAELRLEGRVAFTEGPAWHSSGNLYFTDIENNRIMRRDPSGKFHVYRTPSGKANGLVFDTEGRLHACEGGGEGGNRRITRTELDGTISVLSANYQGNKYNSPNDLVLDRSGRIYFTDPRYGDRDDMQITDAEGKEIEGVYRIDPDGSVHLVITHEVERPNGIALSKDGTFLYVCDNMNDTPTGNRKLWQFEVGANGSINLKSQKLLFDWGTDRGPDGMTVGPDGNLYVTAGFNFPSLPNQTADRYKAGVYVFSPEAEHLRTIPVPIDMITNCTFGGENGNTLFITAGHKLWSLEIAPSIPKAIRPTQ